MNDLKELRESINKAEQYAGGILSIVNYTDKRMETLRKALFMLCRLDSDLDRQTLIPLVAEYFNNTHDELEKLPNLAKMEWETLWDLIRKRKSEGGVDEEDE